MWRTCPELSWLCWSKDWKPQPLAVSCMLCCLLLPSWFPKLKDFYACISAHALLPSLVGFLTSSEGASLLFFVFLLSFSFYSALSFKLPSQLFYFLLPLSFCLYPLTLSGWPGCGASSYNQVWASKAKGSAKQAEVKSSEPRDAAWLLVDIVPDACIRGTSCKNEVAS